MRLEVVKQEEANLRRGPRHSSCEIAMWYAIAKARFRNAVSVLVSVGFGIPCVSVRSNASGRRVIR